MIHIDATASTRGASHVECERMMDGYVMNTGYTLNTTHMHNKMLQFSYDSNHGSSYGFSGSSYGSLTIHLYYGSWAFQHSEVTIFVGRRFAIILTHRLQTVIRLSLP